MFGAGDGSTILNLPDVRGEFIHGWDDSRGVDRGSVPGGTQTSQNLLQRHSATASTASARSHQKVPFHYDSSGSATHCSCCRQVALVTGHVEELPI
ncbi:hypothetical protein [Pseudomonas flavocrustae]|uniref:hypothetical protein n=1 Tax=Pseudomonas flavocrustae TaxID=2991719 RepID=UPI003D677265